MIRGLQNLSSVLPVYDTPQTRAAWAEARAVLERVGELGVPHAMGVETRAVLVKMVRTVGARTVLDVGTSTGTSALAFALAVGEGGKVVSLDIRDANAPGGKWKQRNRPYSPSLLMHAAGVADRVTFLTMDSLAYLRSTPETFDFISLDGSHRSSVVYREIPLALSRLNSGGLLFLDDMHPPGFIPNPGCEFIPGPWEAVRKHVTGGAGFSVIHPIEGLPVAFLVRT